MVDAAETCLNMVFFLSFDVDQVNRRSFCTVWRVLRVSVWGLANGRLGPPWRVVRFLRVLMVFKGFKGLRAGLDAHKKPLMCGLGVPVGCRMKHAKGMFKRCGIGATLLPARCGVPSSFCTVCRVLRVLRVSVWGLANGRLGPPWRVVRVLRVLMVFKGFKGLRAGKRQAWTPIRSHWCVALGCLLAAGWSMPRECLSDVALGQRYCLHGAAFRAAFAQFAGF